MSTPPPDASDLSHDGQPDQRTLRLAGFGARLAGGLLDGLLYGLVWAVFAVPGVLVRRQGYDECVWYRGERFCPDGWPKQWVVAGGVALILIGGVVALALYTRALGRTGRTWGRTIVGVEVVSRHDGQPLGVATETGSRGNSSNKIRNFACLLWLRPAHSHNTGAR